MPLHGLKKNSFIKTKVTRSQRNGKDSSKMNYWRWVAGRRLTTGSILKKP
jgi:hypothetical protein